jgi:hypothetical protein
VTSARWERALVWNGVVAEPPRLARREGLVLPEATSAQEADAGTGTPDPVVTRERRDGNGIPSQGTHYE